MCIVPNLLFAGTNALLPPPRHPPHLTLSLSLSVATDRPCPVPSRILGLSADFAFKDLSVRGSKTRPAQHQNVWSDSENPSTGQTDGNDHSLCFAKPFSLHLV